MLWHRILKAAGLALWLAIGGCMAAPDEDEARDEAQQALLSPDDNWISISSAADVATRRSQLVSYIWGAGGWPSVAATAVTHDPIICPTADLENLQSVSQLKTLVSVSATTTTTYGCHFKPQLGNERAVVVNLGHWYTYYDPTPGGYQDGDGGFHRMINSLLRDGYSVVAMYMPECDPTDWPASCTASHNALFAANPSGAAFRFFLEPIAAAVNYLTAQPGGFQDYSMVGFSGGGWATLLYSALDPSIRFGFDMSGSMPLYTRGPASFGDAEQNLSDLYYRNPTLPGNNHGASYKDLYIMASHGVGRKFVQVLRRRDTCCFGEGSYNTSLGTFSDVIRDYEFEVRDRLVSIAPGLGSFRVEIDETDGNSHMMSWNGILNQVLAELNGGRRYIESKNWRAFVRGANGHLWTRQLLWVDTGIAFVGVPAIAEGVIHNTDVFFRDEGNQLRHAYNDGTWHVVTAPMLGSAITDPEVASFGLDLYVVTTDRDYSLKVFKCNASGCFLMQPSVQAIGPAAVVADSTSIDVFFRGRFDRGIHRAHYAGSSWSTSMVGGTIVDFPTAIRATPGYRVFVRGVSPHLWEFRGTGSGGWTATNLSQQLGVTSEGSYGTPDVSFCSGSPNPPLQVHARSAAGNLVRYQLSFPTGDWTYANLGGVITGSPTSVPAGAYARGQAMNLWFRNSSTWHGYGGTFD